MTCGVKKQQEVDVLRERDLFFNVCCSCPQYQKYSSTIILSQ